MWNSKKSILLSIAVCFLVAALLLGLAVAFPWLRDWYFLSVHGKLPEKGAIPAVTICFYLCLVPATWALYELIRMLFRIRKDNPFCTENVKALRHISWACALAAVLCIIGAVWYLPLILIAVAAGFMAMILRVVKNVMEKAVALREENDLTV